MQQLQVSNWKSELEAFQANGLKTMGLNEQSKLSEHIQALQQELLDLEKSTAEAAEYNNTLLKATESYFKALNELGSLKNKNNWVLMTSPK